MNTNFSFKILLIIIMVVSTGCGIHKEWKKEELKKSKYNNFDFENYITAEVTTDEITAKAKKIELLLRKTDKKELRFYDTFMELEVNLSDEWYVVPLISNDYMWEMPIYFEAESNEVWLDFRSFEMRPGRYRVLIPYYIEGNKTKYYTPAEFTCK